MWRACDVPLQKDRVIAESLARLRTCLLEQAKELTIPAHDTHPPTAPAERSLDDQPVADRSSRIQGSIGIVSPATIEWDTRGYA